MVIEEGTRKDFKLWVLDNFDTCYLCGHVGLSTFLDSTQISYVPCDYCCQTLDADTQAAIMHAERLGKFRRISGQPKLHMAAIWMS